MATVSESSGAYSHCDENVCSVTVGTDPDDCDASVTGPTPTPTPTPGPGPGPTAVPEFSPMGLIALIGVLSVLLVGTTIGRRKRR